MSDDTFSGLTRDEIRAKMDALYAKNEAYPMPTLWDRDRHRRLNAMVLALGTEGRDPGVTLDVGCGQGGIASYWPTPTVGVEISEEACRLARAAYPKSEFIASPIETFQDPAGRRFRTVTAVESIEHWTDVPAGLASIRQHMAPDGRLILTTPNYDSLHHRIGRKLGVKTPFCSNHHVKEFGFEELIDVLQASGFRVVTSRGVGLMPYWALEEYFGKGIRKLTEQDPEVVEWLGGAAEHIPHLAFIQVHVCTVG